jgi:Transcription factor WhiB
MIAMNSKPRPLCTAEWVDPSWWYTANSTLRETARILCAECPLAQVCLDRALAHEGAAPIRYRHGIWAGTSPAQRWRIATGRSPRPSLGASDPLMVATPPKPAPTALEVLLLAGG